MPILALLPFIDRNFEEKFAVLRRGKGGKGGYMTVKQALEDGAVVLRYGYVMLFLFVFCSALGGGGDDFITRDVCE